MVCAVRQAVSIATTTACIAATNRSGRLDAAHRHIRVATSLAVLPEAEAEVVRSYGREREDVLRGKPVLAVYGRRIVLGPCEVERA